MDLETEHAKGMIDNDCQFFVICSGRVIEIWVECT